MNASDLSNPFFVLSTGSFGIYSLVMDSKGSEGEGVNVEEEDIPLSHEDLVELTQKTLTALTQAIPLLSDLPPAVTFEEVAAQVELEQGQSITVYVMRGDGEIMKVVVPSRGATVRDLKAAIARHMALRLSRQSKGKQRPVKISWRYIWRSHWLSADGINLRDDSALLSEYGVSNRSKVSFVPRLNERGRRLLSSRAEMA
ncbi:U11/U12 small nuclear ribonucleoprotein 25 kDa protein-like isoform X2 [Ischnura elegans]|uniref:U11/U12 small nuclear ribonucleoprotein 25 kDa protein-like isoform X2 n=1 Tax=Ischnura elegans TaxID=197161 RepID=UPI001ED8B900|nr:U11/U12 small nuclear ribonucleoprotein 25 kDa protein-like isoform X2 [Ischnura elegans]